MAFETVNVPSLRSSLYSCKNAINHTMTDQLIEEVVNSNVWQSDARMNLKNALEKLQMVRYKELERKLDSYFPVVDKIEEYQRLVKENQELEKEYSSLLPHLYKIETYHDSKGRSHTRRVKDLAVERRMMAIKAQIAENQRRMQELERQVANSI